MQHFILKCCIFIYTYIIVLKKDNLTPVFKFFKIFCKNIKTDKNIKIINHLFQHQYAYLIVIVK